MAAGLVALEHVPGRGLSVGVPLAGASGTWVTSPEATTVVSAVVGHAAKQAVEKIGKLRKQAAGLVRDVLATP